ncbi:MAG: hypothetical protein KAI50_14020, partial [Desulfobacterales bacterium]|nr:hypothetical protein [Desulfobacterales bacterium]
SLSLILGAISTASRRDGIINTVIRNGIIIRLFFMGLTCYMKAYDVNVRKMKKISRGHRKIDGAKSGEKKGQSKEQMTGC